MLKKRIISGNELIGHLLQVDRTYFPSQGAQFPTHGTLPNRRNLNISVNIAQTKKIHKTDPT